MGKSKQKEAEKAGTISVAEAGKRLGISRNLAYRAAAEGSIPTIRIGKRWLIPIQAFEKFLQQTNKAA